MTIRDLFSDSKAMRYGTQEQQRLLDISNQLRDEASEALKSIDLLINEQSIDICTQTSFNEPDDKIILMP